MALGETDRAAELILGLSIPDRGMVDPCGIEALEPLRRSSRNADVFSHCPDRPAGD